MGFLLLRDAAASLTASVTHPPPSPETILHRHNYTEYITQTQLHGRYCTDTTTQGDIQHSQGGQGEVVSRGRFATEFACGRGAVQNFSFGWLGNCLWLRCGAEIPTCIGHPNEGM